MMMKEEEEIEWKQVNIHVPPLEDENGIDVFGADEHVRNLWPPPLGE